MATPTIYTVEELTTFATRVLHHSGLALEPSRAVAEALVEGEIMGHLSHGLRLLEPYLKEIAQGRMTSSGEPETIIDNGHFALWEGHYLPGPWVIAQGITLAAERVKQQGMFTLSIRRSHHIAALIAYLKTATDQNLFILLACSDPDGGGVTPYGGRTPLYTANPIAAGIPTDNEPILIEVSMSTQAYGKNEMLLEQGEGLPDRVLIDNEGRPSDDPAVLFSDPPGAILPLGGLHYGYKGFALGLMVEAMTSALSGGMGRVSQPDRWGANVFLQFIDPKAFGGYDSFIAESSWLAEACRNTEPAQGFDKVRLPGAQALASRQKAHAGGVELSNILLKQLENISKEMGISL